MFFSTFTLADSHESLLALDLELQNCDSVGIVKYIGASMSSDWYLMASKVMSGISDLRASNRSSAPGLIVERFRRACLRLSISPSEYDIDRGKGRCFTLYIRKKIELEFYKRKV